MEIYRFFVDALWSGQANGRRLRNIGPGAETFPYESFFTGARRIMEIAGLTPEVMEKE